MDIYQRGSAVVGLCLYIDSFTNYWHLGFVLSWKNFIFGFILYCLADNEKNWGQFRSLKPNRVSDWHYKAIDKNFYFFTLLFANSKWNGSNTELSKYMDKIERIQWPKSILNVCNWVLLGYNDYVDCWIWWYYSGKYYVTNLDVLERGLMSFMMVFCCLFFGYCVNFIGTMIGVLG